MSKIDFNEIAEQARSCWKTMQQGQDVFAKSSLDKDRIGVVFDDDGVVLSLRLASTRRLEDLQFFAYGDKTAVTPKERVDFLLSVLPSFYTQYQTCDFWVGEQGGDLALIKLPPVGEDEIDSVALLKAHQQLKFDPQATLLDYRLEGQAGNALALAIPRAICQDWQNAFKKAGLSLAGLTSRKLATVSLLVSGVDQGPWSNYAVCHLADDISVLTLVDKGEALLIRTFNFGFNRLLGDVVERMTGAFPESGDPTNTQYQQRLIARAQELFQSQNLSKEEQRALEEALKDNVLRMVQYIERTFNYYERVEHRPMPEGIMVVADEGVSQALSLELEKALGIPCMAKRAGIEMTQKARNGLDQIRKHFKSASLFESASLAFASDSTPNVMQLPAQRRARQKSQKVGLLVQRIALMICMVVGLFGVYQGWGWWQAQQQLVEVKKQLSLVQEPFTVEVLQSKLQGLKQYEGRAHEVALRQRFISLMSQVGVLQSEHLYVSAMDFQTVSAKVARQSMQNTQSTVLPNHELNLKVVLLGNGQEREAALAHFINNLEAMAQASVVTVTPVNKTTSDYEYKVRLLGRF